MATRSAALKLDWNKVTTSLGLRGQTVVSLQAFKKRNEDARRRLQALSQLPTTVEFDQYRAQLKNQTIVDEIEKKFRAFKPKTYDVKRQIKAIESFEAEAMRDAQDTRKAVDAQLVDLRATLSNIEQSRPLQDLTADDVAAAEPRIDEKLKRMLQNGQWHIPGYEERFGKLSVM